VVNFHPVPHAILPQSAASSEPNRLVIRLQPDEGVKLFLLVKVPGEGMRVKPVALDLDFAETFKHRQWEAYERLLMEVIQGNLTLFMRRDELAAAWHWVDPILEGWHALDEPPKPYTAGTWGPAAASALILRDGLAWREEA
jgi:glucose-6-phosphate 1-dehydrogenase